ncbi:WXG100 family type VII secretion target [Actinomadura opuntiae]|uniref:WXG100 family type VII secretion target n=1 Tax=Actinomadura sp. OS1-43 TaxID=604315 RepID=UPI00255ABEAA|nr:hypothetical protein [Actinomadura sp. OS1-43]MDL4816851.1 hypothetical protein [Actinomadura sp. OS1-43]
MAPELKVDHEQMLKSGRDIGNAATDLRSHWQQFQGELSSYGQPWGEDDIGSIIGGCYQAVLEVFQDCLDDNIEGVAEHGDGVQTMAAGYREAEDTSAIEVNRVNDVL